MNNLINQIDTSLVMYTKIPKGGIGAEIGVCRGSNATGLYIATKPSMLHLVDLWEPDLTTKRFHSIGLHYDNWMSEVANLFSVEIENDKIKLHKSNSIDFLNSINDHYLDWVYLDADHKYDSVKPEIELACKKVKSGGYIMGHDFIVHEKAWKTGVIRAVIETIQEGKIVMEYITTESFPSYMCRVL